ncbi:energy transducer TonB [bacterium]|nr:energy transducer TonB [bacterium]
MNRSTFALFVALLIHFVFLLLFWILGMLTPELKKTEPKEEKEQKIKISLKEMPIKHKESGLPKEEPKQEPMPIAPPMPKGSQLEKIVEQPPVKYEPKQEPKKTQLNKKPKPSKPEPKPIEQPKVEPLPPEKPYIPLIEQKIEKPKPKKEQKKEDSLFDILSQDKSAQEVVKEETKTSSGGNISQNIKELYGDEFGKMTPGQQQYLIDNQEVMRRITQQVLTRVARVNIKENLNVNKTNIIEFYLHPNGDMTDFKFLKKSGYYVLDDTTKETIEYAYSRYPRPNEKILIRYNVFYNLANY